MSLTIAILLAAAGIVAGVWLHLVLASLRHGAGVCTPPADRPDLWGTHDAYVEAVLARGRRRRAAEDRARRLGMTARRGSGAAFVSGRAGGGAAGRHPADGGAR